MSTVVNIVAVLPDGSIPTAGTDPLIPASIPLVMTQGEDVIIKAKFRKTDGSLVNLAGCAGVLGLAASPVDASQEGPEPLFLRAGAINGPASNGDMWFTLAPADTLPIAPAGKYEWDLWLTLADSTRSRVVLLSQFVVSGSIAVPGAPVTAPVVVVGEINGQSGVEQFVAQTEKTVTLPTAFTSTGYSVLLGANFPVLVYYEKISVSQFKLKSSASFTGEVSWRATT